MMDAGGARVFGTLDAASAKGLGLFLKGV